jgi:4-hydroxybenzoate polyprenyltransferase
MTLYHRLKKYQYERYPLRFLTFTTLSSVLASAAVTNNAESFPEIVLLLVASLLMLFHIRVIDEIRDTAFDNKNYPDRALQSGVIKTKELVIIDIAGMTMVFVLAIAYGYQAILWVLTFTVFTLFARYDFFIPKLFHQRPILYHLVNAPQIIFLQLFMYAVFTQCMDISIAMWLQLALAFVNIFILEVIRKIKPVEKDPNLYSAVLGFGKAHLFVMAMLFLSFALFIFTLIEITTNPLTAVLAAGFFVLLFCFSIIKNMLRPSEGSEKMMLLSGVLFYIGLHTILYFSQVL